MEPVDALLATVGDLLWDDVFVAPVDGVADCVVDGEPLLAATSAVGSVDLLELGNIPVIAAMPVILTKMTATAAAAVRG